MSIVTIKPEHQETNPARQAIMPAPDTFPYPKVKLIESDGVPLESDWHRLAMTLLIDVVYHVMHGREDYFVGGDMFLYFNEEQARDRDYRGPDFFFVRGVSLNPPRPYWAIWLEGGRYPDLIIELASHSTLHIDRTIKKDIYEKTFHTYEYFIFDPATNTLEGWRLVNHKHEPIIPNDKGWLWCDELGLWLGTWTGKFQGKDNTYLRFYDRQGKLVYTEAEAAQDQLTLEKQRADAAEAELARLKATLANGPKGQA